MKGWTPDGEEIELLPRQETLVKEFMDLYDHEIYLHIFPLAGQQYGKTLVTATIRQLRKNKEETGEWYPGGT